MKELLLETHTTFEDLMAEKTHNHLVCKRSPDHLAN